MSDTKVLYISHMREGTGWGNVAIDNMRALEAAGVNVVARNVTLTQDKNIPVDIEAMERKECHDATHCIQHVLPHHLVSTDRYERNIAYFVAETRGFLNTDWKTNLSLMDEIWTCDQQLVHPIQTKCNVPVSIVHHPVDPNKYQRQYPKFSIPEIDHTFKFYTICDLNDRKNIEGVIRCFHSAFDPSDPVSLILKVKKHGYDEQQLNQYVQQICSKIKEELRIHNTVEQYHREVIISSDLANEQILALHQYADCYINLSHGEAWSMPTFDAMAFGNYPIVTGKTGMREYITGYGIGVPSVKVICNCSDSAFPFLFNGRDFWEQPDEDAVVRCMQHLAAADEFPTSKEQCLEHARKFSHEKIGNTMKELLSE